MVVSVDANLGMEAPVAVSARVATGEHRWEIVNVSQELFSTRGHLKHLSAAFSNLKRLGYRNTI